MSKSSFVFASILAVAAGCGGGQSEPKAADSTTSPATSATPSASASAAPATSLGPSKPWKEMSLEEKKLHMKTNVMPKMTETFQSFDKAKFANVTCVTCHGPTAKSGNFAMPNPALPKLSVADGFKKHKESKPEMTKFMMERVTPDMIALLGAKPYDPATHQGFGCGGCHTFEK